VGRFRRAPRLSEPRHLNDHRLVRDGRPQEAQAAIEAARRAFADPAWRTDRLLRAQVLNRMADRFEERTGDLVELLGLENGKTHDQGRLEVAFAPETLRFNAALALTDTGTNSQVTDGELSLVVRQPVGVAGIIAPWNSPVALGIRSLAPALAAGCTAVMNLPWQTAQVNSLIAELVGETAGLPPRAHRLSGPGRARGATARREGGACVGSGERDGPHHRQAQRRAHR
jgi:betaine-aldehyde dehydrogenase